MAKKKFGKVSFLCYGYLQEKTFSLAFDSAFLATPNQSQKKNGKMGILSRKGLIAEP